MLKNVEKTGSGKRLTFDKIPETLDELRELDITDEYQAACAVIFSLAAFEKNEEKGKEMFEYVNGPENMSAFDLSFIRGQLSQYPYVMRSYFDGATPQNGYMPQGGISLTISENTYSRWDNHCVNFFIHSGGVDNDRMFKLRQKPSTGEWFILSDSYKGLMAGIRMPEEENKWA